MKKLTLLLMPNTGLTSRNHAPLRAFPVSCNLDSLFEQIIGEEAVVESRLCPRGFSVQVDGNWVRDHDGTGERLCFTYADELIKAAMPPEAPVLDRALWGSLAILARDIEGCLIPIVLYFH